MHDWGSRDATFLTINAQVLERLPEIVNAAGTHVTVPDAGLGHLRRRGDADDLRAAARARCCCSSTAPTASARKRICEIAGRAS